jgi:hypothetical protein
MDRSVDVTLIEGGTLGQGTTSTNHGRLHLGTATWHADSIDLIRRRHAGSLMWRLLPIAETTSLAVYAFESPDLFAAFIEKCGLAGISVRPCVQPPAGPWMRPDEHAYVELPEHAFNPSAVAGALAGVALRNGAVLMTGSPVLRLELAGGTAGIVLARGRVDAGVVVNVTGRWSSTIDVSPPVARQAIDWFRWPVLMARTGGLPRLDRVLVRVTNDHANPSVVPHGAWMTFDTKAADPQEQPTVPFGPVSSGIEPVSGQATETMFDRCLEAFPALRSLGSNPYMFFGIQGRARGAPPGSINRISLDPQWPNYLVAFGGQASTALLDAYDCATRLWLDGHVAVEPRELLRRLIQHFPEAGTSSAGAPSDPARAPMPWEELVHEPD